MRGYVMKLFLALLLFVMASGCAASIQNGTDFQAGRNALQSGKSEAALSYFQSVAENNPGYQYGTAYRQGVLGFLGRSQYEVGQLPQAQKTLERALALNRNDN